MSQIRFSWKKRSNPRSHMRWSARLCALNTKVRLLMMMNKRCRRSIKFYAVFYMSIFFPFGCVSWTKLTSSTVKVLEVSFGDAAYLNCMRHKSSTQKRYLNLVLTKMVYSPDSFFR